MVLNKVESERNSRLTSDYDGEIVMVDRKGILFASDGVGWEEWTDGRIHGKIAWRPDLVDQIKSRVGGTRI
jgi:hypothetical protein